MIMLAIKKVTKMMMKMVVVEVVIITVESSSMVMITMVMVVKAKDESGQKTCKEEFPWKFQEEIKKRE